jgi:hypothetical protein
MQCATSHLTPHTSHLTPHTSHITPHTSHLTPHTSHLTPHSSPASRAAARDLISVSTGPATSGRQRRALRAAPPAPACGPAPAAAPATGSRPTAACVSLVLLARVLGWLTCWAGSMPRSTRSSPSLAWGGSRLLPLGGGVSSAGMKVPLHQRWRNRWMLPPSSTGSLPVAATCCT